MIENKFVEWIRTNKNKIIVKVILFILFLPLIGFFWRFIPKVNPNSINLSRLEVLKLVISLIGPVLTFIVFQNTLEMQSKSDNQRKEDKDEQDAINANLKEEQKELAEQQKYEKNKQLTRDLYLETENEFYRLFDLLYNLKNANEGRVMNDVDIIYTQVLNGRYGYINQYYLKKKDLSESKIYGLKEVIGESLYTIEYCSNLPRNTGTVVADVANGDTSLIEVLNEQYDNFHDSLGPYFKLFHRILKNLNKRFNDEHITISQYSDFIGILRTQISSKEFVVLFYNAFFVKRGVGMGTQLLGTGFFGDDFDFKTNQHFETPKKIVEKTFLSLTTLDDSNIQDRKNILEMNSFEIPTLTNEYSMFLDLYDDYQINKIDI